MRVSCRPLTLLLGTLVLLLSAPAIAAPVPARHPKLDVPTRQSKPDVAARFASEGGVAQEFLARARTIPHWTFQYTDPTNGVTYPITMAGGDPRAGNTTTSIHTVIVPLRMNFVAGNQDTSAFDDAGYFGYRAVPVSHTFDGTGRAQDVLDSPIFSIGFTTPLDMGGDTAQVGDAFVRAQWSKLNTGYHLALVNDTVLPAQTIDVPASKGLAYQRPVGAWRELHGYGTTDTISGFAEYAWFSNRVQNLINSLHISSTTVPIVLTDNVLLYEGHDAYRQCCVLGYHGAAVGASNGMGNQPVQTYMFSAWLTPGVYSGFLADYTDPNREAPNPTRGIADIHSLSHELSEFLDDPFINNVVQPWHAVTAPQYGCSDLLETGRSGRRRVVPLRREHRAGSAGNDLLRPVPPRGRGLCAVVRTWRDRARAGSFMGRPLHVHGRAHDQSRRQLGFVRHVRAQLLAARPLLLGSARWRRSRRRGTERC
jgi:hypothetical protein